MGTSLPDLRKTHHLFLLVDGLYLSPASLSFPEAGPIAIETTS